MIFTLHNKLYPYKEFEISTLPWIIYNLLIFQFSSVQSISHVRLFVTHGLQHTRPPCPSPTPGVYPNPCPLCLWCHPTISSSVIPCSSHPQSFPASGSFQMSQLFTSGGQSIGVSASASILPMNTQDFRMDWLDLLAVQGTLKNLLLIFICPLFLFIVLFLNYVSVQFSSVYSLSVVSDSLRPHESQHARPPCPSPTPGVHSNSHPSSWWCHPAISSSVIPFSPCPQSLPASESFPMSQHFAWGGQSTGVSALASFLPKNSQDWAPLEWTDCISLQSKGFSRVFSNTAVQRHQFFSTQLSSQSNSHIHTWPLEKP